MFRIRGPLLSLAIPALNPVCRAALRLNGSLARPLWYSFVQPWLAWRHFEFTTKSKFGATFSGDTYDLIQKSIYYFGLWEPQVAGVIQRRFRRGTFIDIGANIGYFSLLASTVPEGTVVAIEPHPQTFQRLSKNVRLNGYGNLRLINAAVAEHEGQTRLYASSAPDNSGKASLCRESGDWFTVNCAPLGSLLTAGEIRSATFVKIDVEGAESLVMEGVYDLLDRLPREVEFLIELSVVGEDAGRSQSICDTMLSHGFHPYALQEDTIDGYFKPNPRMALPLTALTRQTDVLFSRVEADAL